MNALGLVVVYFLLNAPDLFVAADSSAKLQDLVKIVNYWCHIGLLITAM